MLPGSSTRWHRPPSRSISATFSALVERGITATKGTSSIRANQVSLTAVDPLDASTAVVPGPIQPLHRACRNSERASRCLRLPVRWVDSSLR